MLDGEDALNFLLSVFSFYLLPAHVISSVGGSAKLSTGRNSMKPSWGSSPLKTSCRIIGRNGLFPKVYIRPQPYLTWWKRLRHN